MGEDSGQGEGRLVGGLWLGEERLAVVLPLWEATLRSIRLMDSLELGETEPATVYVWEDRP